MNINKFTSTILFFKKISLVILPLSIASCSVNPRVHLYYSDASTDKKQQLVSFLKEYDFNVTEFYNTAPDLEEGNYIVYYPEKNTEKSAEHINLALLRSNLSEAQMEPYRIGNGIGSHEYTKGNIGLYIIKKNSVSNDVIEDKASQSFVDFTGEQFGSKDCSSAFQIEFYDDGRAIFIYEESSKKHSEARWELLGSTLIIKKLFGSSKFQVKTYTVSIAENTVTVTDLLPVNSKKAPFNCTYSTYYKEGIYKLPSS
ncbi:hypothetical protein [Cellvibrio sp. PSBB023]|uniref:hypothetical protein n=1 Tax=Cellvibrio sp. PSBB023 TaxID=1945512 RepID=UPI00098FC516|nr:hypothetical protein [Cellvibrio sp. PSBB023]AQT60522.1 hypothetical protein B0D95_10795 [Cellvibrio sp. PSBB023]